MRNKQIVLGIDVGAKSGIAVNDNGELMHFEPHKIKNLTDWNTKVKELIDLWKPDIIVTGVPTRFRNTIIKHSKYIAIIELALERYKIPLVQVVDSSCKREVLGSGKADKNDIVAWAKEKSGQDLDEDSADAYMFTEYVIKTNNNKK